MAVPPDDRTWVLERPCPECGFDARAMPLTQAGELLTAAVARLHHALSRPDARTRPAPTTWSPLEYACHVRDTGEVFSGRIALIREHDNPTFPNWDQDATAVERRYDRQDPLRVAVELTQSLDALINQLDAVPDTAWHRQELRSNGSRFTLETLVRYLVHDPLHHAHDVERGTAPAAT